ncbi:MAG: acetate--CoA ligase [Chloroflexota bacterium]|nr:acetate--CoA ligase [Chloroflexota bacterium]
MASNIDLVGPIVREIQRRSLDESDAFWSEAASRIPWFREWDEVFEWTPEEIPAFRWFIGGETNLAYACLDAQVDNGSGGRAALIALDENGVQRVFTYAQLLKQVERIAASLRAIGIERGDRVAVYMPTNFEAIALMLACARIGAVHLVIFAGFGAGAIAERIKLAEAKAIFCTDSTYRRGRNVPLDHFVRGALENEGADEFVETVVVERRLPDSPNIGGDKEMRWQDFLAGGEGGDGSWTAMEANDPAYILATSGTTARPKLCVHTHGGYPVWVASMADWVFDIQPEDVWWATSDIGWVVGHSYIVYGPLLAGATTIAFEGALDHPDVGTFYRIIEDHGVTGMFTSPTAIRLLMRSGTEPAEAVDMTSLTRVFSAGEVLNPPAWEWFQHEIFGDEIPVLDHMWQTETGGPIIGNPYGIQMLPIKPGSAGIPLPGIEGTVLDTDGAELAADDKGIFAITRPFPGLTARLWGEPERYQTDYWGKVPGRQVYFTGDATSVDEDGYVWFSGRADEIIKIAAHRIGTIEVESAILRHPGAAEAGVTGRPDELRGEVISAFVVLKAGFEPGDDLKSEILQTIRGELGPVAVNGELNFVDALPKTRSGKIMRRVLKAVTLDTDPGDISTIEDEGSVEDARSAWEQMKASIR